MATIAGTLTAPSGSRPYHAMHRLVLSWVLTIPLLFFSTHGTFSWEDSNNNPAGGNSLSALASSTRHLGIVGYVIIPGIAYSIVVWLILINWHRIFVFVRRMRLLMLLTLV